MTEKNSRSEKNIQSTFADQEFLSTFENHAAILLLIEPVSGLILDANLAAINFYGYPKLRGMFISDLNSLPPDQVTRVREKQNRSEQKLEYFSQRLASGEHRRVELQSSPFTIQGQQVLFYIIHDMSRRTLKNTGLNKADFALNDSFLDRDAELEVLRIYQVELEMQNAELRRSQALIESMRARYFSLYDLAPVGYCTINPEGLIVETNLSAARMLGATREFLVGKLLHSFITKNYQDSFYVLRVKLFKTGLPQTCELQMVSKNRPEEVVWVFIKASLAQDVIKAHEGLIVISDISERKQAEAAELEREIRKREHDLLVNANEERRILLDNIQTQVWYQTDDHTYGIVNDAHSGFLGVPKDSLSSKSIYDFVQKDLLVHFIKDVQEVFASGLALISEVWLPNALGERRLLSISTAPILNPDGAIQQVICSAEDITERKKTEEALRQSEQRYRIVVEWAPYAIVIHRDGKIIYVNPSAMKMFGALSAQELVGSPIYDRIHPNSQQSVRSRLKKSAEEGSSAPMTELQYIRLDGTVLDAEVQGIPILFDGLPAIYAVLAEITERKKAEEALLYTHWQLESTIESSHVGTWEWNVQAGTEIINHVWAEQLGYTLAELTPFHINTSELLTQPDDLIQSRKLLELHFANEFSFYDFECRMKHKDGHWVWLQDRGRVITRSPDGKPLLMFGTHTDISERKAAEEEIRILNVELEKLTVTDYLTNLYNLRYFMRRGAEEFNRAIRNNQPLALLMVDIDWFKMVNDTYGHESGDLALQQVALILKSSLREIDILGRIGGEEFGILLPNTSMKAAMLLAERIRKSVADTLIILTDFSFTITVSIGVSEYTNEMASINALLKYADEGLYFAKHAGRNCVKVFEGLLPPPPGRGMIGLPDEHPRERRSRYIQNP